MHIPGYIEKLSELRSKGVDIVAVIAFNDAFVMSAWGKINGMKDEDMVRTYQLMLRYMSAVLMRYKLFMADTETKFSEKIGWHMADTGRNLRYAIAIDHGKVIYAEKEEGREIKVCVVSSRRVAIVLTSPGIRR